MAKINWGRLIVGSLITSIIATIAGAALYKDAATPVEA